MKIAMIDMIGVGAGAAYGFEMTRALLEHGCAVLAMIPRVSDNGERWGALAREFPLLEIFRVDCYAGSRRRLVKTLRVSPFFAMRRAVKRFGARAIYSPMTHLWHNILFAWFTPRGVVRVKTIHDVEPHLGVAKGWSRRIAHSLQFRDSERSVILSERFRPVLVERGVAPERIVVIPHPNFDYYGAPAVLPAFRFRGRVLFFGAISPYKGLGVLLSAMEIVRRSHPEVTLVVAGGGDTTPYAAALERLADSVECHLHRIDDGDVAALFLGVDYVVLPYIEASQSGVIPLAYSFGKPVVASAIGGIPEQVEDGVTGILVPPGDVHALAAAMVFLLSSPRRIGRMGREAKKYAVEKLSWSAAALKLKACFESASLKNPL
jgi:glycosyltransferase involved in cell wall biosynthesis